jgi:hypothetical protein
VPGVDRPDVSVVSAGAPVPDGDVNLRRVDGGYVVSAPVSGEYTVDLKPAGLVTPP